MERNWIGRAVAAIFGGARQNGFVAHAENVQPIRPDVVPEFLRKPEEAPDEFQGIPESRRQEVKTRQAIAVMAGNAMTPQQAWGALQTEWQENLRRFMKNRELRAKYSAQYLERNKITANDYSWGVRFEGTLEALRNAALLPANMRPLREEQSFYLPLSWEESWNEWCYGSSKQGAKPERWNGTFSLDTTFGETDSKGQKVYAVLVSFEAHDIAERTQKAIAELDSEAPNMDLARLLVRSIQPEPLSIAIPQEILYRNKLANEAAKEAAKAKSKAKAKK